MTSLRRFRTSNVRTMEQEVRLYLSTYDALQRQIQTKKERIDALEKENARLKQEHEDEIRQLTEEGKVRCIGIKRHPFIPFLVSEEKEYKGFDDVKAEVEEHFKGEILDDEVASRYEKLLKQAEEREDLIDRLKADNKRLRTRSLWERIRNK